MTETFIITGDTYSSRQELKAIAGRWVPHLKAWLVPATVALAAEAQPPAVLLRQIIGAPAHHAFWTPLARAG